MKEIFSRKKCLVIGFTCILALAWITTLASPNMVAAEENTPAPTLGPSHPDVFKIIYVAGTDYEQGYQHGYQLAKEISLWADFLWSFVSGAGNRT